MQDTTAAEPDHKMKIKISVRSLVEFIFRSGDIDNRKTGAMQADAMQRGSRLHRKLQKKAGPLYHPEVPLKMEFEEENYTIVLEGRADGIIIEETEVTIDEIKGVFADVTKMTEPVAVHLAQAKCYAFIYALQNGCEQTGVRMTYASLDTEERRYFTFSYSFGELEQWFLSMMNEYKKWAQFQYEWRKTSRASIKKLEFPFPYRDGQKELVSGVYRTILRKKILFIQAPTGTGKTLSTLFPAVKAVGEEIGDKIFYLTAKTITATVAKETLELFYQSGYRAKTVQIMAKEKMCLQQETVCNPQACPYAKGHYDRVNDAVYGLLHKADLFTREVILEQAQAYLVCPFELCLDTASFADNIICDYNYVFDPKVYLKRFFAEGIRGEYLFLVDEAHNLVERGREMYSARLYKEDFLNVKKIVKMYSGNLERGLKQCNRIMLDYKRECETFRYYEDISVLVFALMRLIVSMDQFLQQNREFEERDTVLEFYYQVRRFLDTCECLDENYVIYTEHTADGRFKLELFCVDPSANLQKRLDKGRSTVFFSATLLPIGYYKSLLSARDDNYAIYAETVFRPQQKLVLIGNDVTSKYTRRGEEEYTRMADYIRRTGMQKKGNYIVFFPSYKMLEDVYEKFQALPAADMDCLLQKAGMDEADREDFLAEFTIERERSLMAFCVMGGIFGEGIDLKEEQLIGAIMIGTGLPQVSNGREILKQFYDSRSGNGFDYAYRYPGMNKVLQAAGRVIRTASDVGIIELLDERFLLREYQALFPREWEGCEVCNIETVEEKLRRFWAQAQPPGL